MQSHQQTVGWISRQSFFLGQLRGEVFLLTSPLTYLKVRQKAFEQRSR